ncbi:MAG: FKBP-type peptidyl-prolyl cis-trans isomerase [Bacteroidales bacterium]|nr:FKBP-type peptidyl-prolyl cis-trans isomerase [Bacteroidales bacterium]
MNKLFFIALILLFFYSCSENNTQQIKNWNKIDKKLIDINKYLVKEDRERIESYILRNDWNMQQTKTGLWFEITKEGIGDNVTENQLATINFRVELLDGTVCYTSDSLGPKTFKVGYGNIEKGLQEGIKLMNVGCKARFIMPPYLAHGLVGDDNKIPPRAIIVYEVELTSVF